MPWIYTDRLPCQGEEIPQGISGAPIKKKINTAATLIICGDCQYITEAQAGAR